MVVLEDFTGLSEGCDVPAEGLVERCPRCGRSGLEQRSEQGDLLIHSQTSEVLGDGMHIELQDACAFPRL